MKKEVRAKIERRLRYSTVVEVKSDGGVRYLSDEEKSVKSLRRMKSRSNWDTKFFRIPYSNIQQELDVRAETEDKFFGRYKEKSLIIEPIRTIDEWLDLLPDGWKAEASKAEPMLQIPWDRAVFGLSYAIPYCCLWEKTMSGKLKWEELSQAVMLSEELPENIFGQAIWIIGSNGRLVVDRNSGRILERKGYEWCTGVDVDEYKRFYGVRIHAGKDYDVLDFILEAESPEGYEFPELWWRNYTIRKRAEIYGLSIPEVGRWVAINGELFERGDSEQVKLLRTCPPETLEVWTGAYPDTLTTEKEIQEFINWFEGE